MFFAKKAKDEEVAEDNGFDREARRLVDAIFTARDKLKAAAVDVIIKKGTCELYPTNSSAKGLAMMYLQEAKLELLSKVETYTEAQKMYNEYISVNKEFLTNSCGASTYSAHSVVEEVYVDFYHKSSR